MAVVPQPDKATRNIASLGTGGNQVVILVVEANGVVDSRPLDNPPVQKLFHLTDGQLVAIADLAEMIIDINRSPSFTVNL